MRLKRLEMYGYKSFASRAVFEFSDGITAIVGPNGSGKSNIADGVRWVLGEQSYSNLRGRRTEDMIFAGSRRRARLGMAEVTITWTTLTGGSTSTLPRSRLAGAPTVPARTNTSSTGPACVTARSQTFWGLRAWLPAITS